MPRTYYILSDFHEKGEFNRGKELFSGNILIIIIILIIANINMIKIRLKVSQTTIQILVTRRFYNKSNIINMRGV